MQFEKTTKGNGVNPSSWLIFKFNQRVCEHRNGAAKLSFVATTEISSKLFSKLSQVKCLLDKIALGLLICET